MKLTSRFLLLASLGLLTLAIPKAASAAATFADTLFQTSDWELIPIAARNLVPSNTIILDPSAGNATGTQQTSGGQPGAFRRVGITVAPTDGSEYHISYGFHRRLGATYDPALFGAIDSITYSEDFETSAATGTCKCQAAGIALRQGGVVYFGFGRQVATPPAPSGWVSSILRGIKASDFCTLPDIWACTQHPDFTTSGAPIDFGFYRGNSNVPSTGYSDATDGGIDNWKVSIYRAGEVASVNPVSAGELSFALRAVSNNPTSGPIEYECTVRTAGRLRLAILDVSGRIVRTLVSRYASIGRQAFTWDAKDDRGKRVTSGVYFVRAELDGTNRQMHVVMVR